MATIPYAEIRSDAFFLTELDARAEVPGVDVRLREINPPALQVWRETWAGIHPSGFGGFPWAELFYANCRDESAFHVSLWSEDVLCAFAIGTVPRSHAALTLCYMARKQNPPNPLAGRVMGIIAVAAEYYAAGLDLPRIEIENPAPGLVDVYRAHGYLLAYESGGTSYLAKQR